MAICELSFLLAVSKKSTRIDVYVNKMSSDFMKFFFSILDLGKKLINATGELASSQEYINQLKDEIKSLTSQITRHQDLSINEQVCRAFPFLFLYFATFP